MRINEIKSSLFWLACVPLIAIIYFIAGDYKSQEKEKILSEGEVAIGEISETAGDYLKVKYTVEDQVYIVPESRPLSNMHDGEKFILKYLNSSPKSIVVEYDKPNLSPDTNYGMVKIEGIETVGSFLSFEYEVDGRIYRRSKFFDEDQLRQPHLYKVKYEFDRPQIGYIVN